MSRILKAAVLGAFAGSLLASWAPSAPQTTTSEAGLQYDLSIASAASGSD